MNEISWRITIDMLTMIFFLASSLVFVAKFTLNRQINDLMLGLSLLFAVPIFLLRVASRPSPPLLSPAFISNGVALLQTIAIVLAIVWVITLLYRQHRVIQAEFRLRKSLEKKEGSHE